MLIALLGFTVAAQQYSITEIGKITTLNNMDLSVMSYSKGTVVLITADHSIYIDRPSAKAIGSALGFMAAGMRELDAKDITIVDSKVLGNLKIDGSDEAALSGLRFRLKFNSTKNDKVLLLMHATDNTEDLVFTTAMVTQLGDLIDKALATGGGYNSQYDNIQAVTDKIDSSIYR
jgi:hypothetical protein